MEGLNAGILEEYIKDHQPDEETQQKILSMSKRESLEMQCERLNRTSQPIFDSKLYNCKKCNNIGFIAEVKDYKTKDRNGNDIIDCAIFNRQCDCWKIRQSLQMLEKSGLTETMKNETFDSYKTPFNWQETVKATAMNFVNSNASCFYIGGFTGSGKTKICSAILNEYIKQDKTVSYLVWNDFISSIMCNINSLDEKVQYAQEVDVLYIDDLYKFEPKPLEKKILYQIINHRTRNNKKTIISSELKLRNGVDLENEIYVYNDLITLDLAVAGRIYESAEGGKYIISIPNRQNFNIRFQNI